jgi:hypothetical protein
MGREVDNQVAAPAGTRTPNWHRAKKRSSRVRMEGWRQRQLGGRKNLVQRKHKKIPLTPTGLLMEGDYTFRPLVNERFYEKVMKVKADVAASLIPSELTKSY